MNRRMFGIMIIQHLIICHVVMDTGCGVEVWTAIPDSSRCAALDKQPFCSIYSGQVISYSDEAMPMCTNFVDQTNCTDTKRGVLTCPVKGYTTALSTAIICNFFFFIKYFSNFTEYSNR